MSDIDPDTYKCAEYVLNRTNVTVDPWPYIECFFGTQTQPLSTAILITVVNGVIFVTGLLGNLAVCIVIIKQPTLHTATNYYLFNLAVSDVTLLIFGLPNDVAMYWHQYPWPFGEFICKFRALISEMASYVSVLTVVAFSTERYIAICYPLCLRAVSGLQRAICIIVCLWAISLGCALPFAVHTTITYVEYPYNSSGDVEETAAVATTKFPESAYCGMVRQPDYLPLAELSTIIFFLVPMVVIAWFYTNMGIAIAKASKTKLEHKMKGSIHRKNKKTQSNRNIIRMLSLVVLGFFVCWAPFHAQRLITVYFRNNEFAEYVNSWLFSITGICYYFSSTLNPILYNVMSDKMRNAFREIFCGIEPKKSLKRGTFRETSNTYVSIPNTNHHHHHHQQQQQQPHHNHLMVALDEGLDKNGHQYHYHHHQQRPVSSDFKNGSGDLETGV